MRDWIKWKGGECPVDPDTVVVVHLHGRATALFPDPAHSFAWDWDRPKFDRIVKYRIHEPEGSTN